MPEWAADRQPSVVGSSRERQAPARLVARILAQALSATSQRQSLQSHLDRRGRAARWHLELHGQKLRGRFVLVRTRSDSRGKEQWLALHKKDEHSRDGWDPEDHPRSVLSGRTNDEVAAAPEREWTRDGERVLVEPARAFDGPTDDELAVIFAHELGHLVLEHRRRLTEAGVEKGFFGEFGRNRRLNRQVEEEADRMSAHLLANAGYDPAIAPAFWRSKLGKRAGGGLFRSGTYPSPGARAGLVETEIATYLGSPLPPDHAAHLLAARDAPFVRN